MGCDRPRTAATHFKQPNTKAENTPLRHLNTPPSFPPQPRHSCVGRNPTTQTILVPLRSSVRGTRASGARPQGDARGRTRCTLAPFVPDERGACERSKHAGYARGGEGPPPQIPTSPEPTPPSHPTPQSQTSFPILHILVQPNHRHTRQSNHAKHRVR